MDANRWICIAGPTHRPVACDVTLGRVAQRGVVQAAALASGSISNTDKDASSPSPAVATTFPATPCNSVGTAEEAEARGLVEVAQPNLVLSPTSVTPEAKRQLEAARLAQLYRDKVPPSALLHAPLRLTVISCVI
jgi:hypothetical protein